MELRDIQYFVVIAEHRHVSRAAEALGLSQPALSKSLRRLEQSVRAKLVRRTPKGIELTREGHALLQRAGELRLSFQNLVREIAEVGEGRATVLRVGIGVSVSQSYVSAALGVFFKAEPRVTLTLVCSDNDVLIPDLRSGALDLVINFTGFPPADGLVTEHLYDEEHRVWASKEHRLVRKKSVTVKDLHAERWAVTEPGVISHQRLYELFRDSGLSQPDVAIVSRNANLRLRAVAASNLLTLGSRSLSQETLASEVKALNVVGLQRFRAIGAIYRDEKYMSPTLRRLVVTLKRTTVDLNLSGDKPGKKSSKHP